MRTMILIFASITLANQPSSIEVPQEGWLFGSSPEDTDNDGITDAEDSCAAEAEDIDGYEDADGCPEDTFVRMVFTDPAGLIETVYAEIDGIGPIRGAGVLEVELPPGEYRVWVNANGYSPMITTFSIANGPAVKVVRELTPLPKDEFALVESRR